MPLQFTRPLGAKLFIGDHEVEKCYAEPVKNSNDIQLLVDLKDIPYKLQDNETLFLHMETGDKLYRVKAVVEQRENNLLLLRFNILEAKVRPADWLPEDDIDLSAELV